MHRLLLTAALLACCAPAVAQNTGVMVFRWSLTDDEYIFGNNFDSPEALTEAVTLSTTNPFFGGVGRRMSMVTFPADGSITPRAVYIPASLERGNVEGIKINGQYVVGQGTASGVTYLGEGIEVDGRYGHVSGAHVVGFQASGIRLDGQDTRAANNEVTACLTGIDLNGADSEVMSNMIFNCRDYGIDVGSGSGSSHSFGNRIFGCNNGGEAGGGTATLGAAMRVSGGGFRSTSDQFADSRTGLIMGGQFGSVTNAYFYQNAFRDIEITGVGHKFVGCLVRCMDSTTEYGEKIAVHMSGARALFASGVIESNSDYQPGHLEGFNGPILVWIDDDNCSIVDTMLVDGDEFTDTVAIVMQGATAVRGTRLLNIGIDGTRFEGANERILDAEAAIVRDIKADFYGNFTDALMVDNPGGNETEGMKKFFDLLAGWTGSITITDTSADTGSPAGAGSTITLQEGVAY